LCRLDSPPRTGAGEELGAAKMWHCDGYGRRKAGGPAAARLPKQNDMERIESD